MNTTKKSSSVTSKKGGNLTKQMSDLAVPFGLILAKQSLEQFLKKEKLSKDKKDVPKDKKSKEKVSLTGGDKRGRKSNTKTPEIKSVTIPSGGKITAAKSINSTKSRKQGILNGGKSCDTVVSGFTPDKKYASV